MPVSGRPAGVQITDGLVGEVINAVRPARPGSHGRAWEHLAALRGVLAERGFTQTDIAGAVGVKQASVSAWVTGKAEPAADMVFQVEAARDTVMNLPTISELPLTRNWMQLGGGAATNKK